MRPRSALAWFLGTGLFGYIGWQFFRAGLALGPLRVPKLRPVALLFLAVFGAFLSTAVALVTLVPAGFEARRRWVRRAAALLPGLVLGFAADQIEEVLVEGGAGATPSAAAGIALVALAASAWLFRSADRTQRVWLGLGLIPGAVLAGVSILTRVGAVQTGAWAATSVLLVGLALEWVGPSKDPRPTPNPED